MKTKVLFIESGKTGGGSFQSLYQFLQGVDRNYITPVVVFLNHTKYVDLVRELDIDVYILRSPLLSLDVNWLIRKAWGRATVFGGYISKKIGLLIQQISYSSLIRDLISIMKSNHIELLYLNTQIDQDFFGIYAAESAGIPCVSHLRSMAGERFSRLKATIANKRVYRFIANSKATRKYWIKKGIEPSLIDVAYNAVSVKNHDNIDLIRQFDLHDNADPVIGCVARLIRLKGHEFLLNAFSTFLRKNKNAFLLLIGEGPEKASLMRLVAKLGIDAHVKFTGYRSDVFDIIASLDVLVLASKYDSFGRVLIEGMALGTPVIGAACYGIKEVIEDRYDGILVPFGDENALCAALDELTKNTEFRDDVIKNGLNKARKSFGIAAHVRRITSIIKEAEQAGEQ